MAEKLSSFLKSEILTAVNGIDNVVLPFKNHADKDLGSLQTTVSGVFALLLDLDAKEGSGPAAISNMYIKKRQLR